MREHFVKNGYAVNFEKAKYIMSPVLFHNIYMGRLGEIVGSFILEKELGIKLNSIDDPERFEVFDYEGKDGIYVDFKNWDLFRSDHQKQMDKILKKLERLNAERVYIVNVCSSEDFKTEETIDERIKLIPALINDDGQIIAENLGLIDREDF